MSTLDNVLLDTKKKMRASIEMLKKEMATVRTGRANASILDSVQVEYYGSMLPINQMGITRVTAESWLSVLQASHLVFLVRPWFTNLNKRLVKTPKLYFCDPGLAAWFVGVRTPDHISIHPQRGALFENWIMTELLKAQTNHGLKPTLHFLRDKEGHEIDALIETGPNTFHAVEIKSGETIASDFFSGLDYWRAKLTRQRITPWLIRSG